MQQLSKFYLVISSRNDYIVSLISLSFGAAKDSENNREDFIVPAERKMVAIVFGIEHGGELSRTVKKFLEIDCPRSRAARNSLD